MCFKAIKWAQQQRGLKPLTRIVLLYLCDRFNPAHGCYPSQDLIAQDCEISRSTLNVHLGKLERAGLLRRVPRIDPATKRQLSTRYILQLEPDFMSADVVPCTDFGHGIEVKAVSGFCPDPCPESDESRVRIPDTNLVREPLNKPVKEEEDAQAHNADFDRFFAKLLSAVGYAEGATLPVWWRGKSARLHVRGWIEKHNLSEAQVLEIAKESRQYRPEPPDGPKALDRDMGRASNKVERTRKTERARMPVNRLGQDFDKIVAMFAEKLNTGCFVAGIAISNSMRDAMLARNLVTPERLRESGII